MSNNVLDFEAKQQSAKATISFSHLLLWQGFLLNLAAALVLHGRAFWLGALTATVASGATYVAQGLYTADEEARGNNVRYVVVFLVAVSWLWFASGLAA